MPSSLPDYDPPQHQRAALAAGLAPILVLLAFTLMVVRWIDVDTGFAVFAACAVWVVYELHVFQYGLDRYNDDYAARHLAWRSSDTLRALVREPATPEPTRAFVSRVVDAQRVVLRDGQLP